MLLALERSHGLLTLGGSEGPYRVLMAVGAFPRLRTRPQGLLMPCTSLIGVSYGQTAWQQGLVLPSWESVTRFR
nr:MAG TPA: hypothetical protein [Caudoviricetes sp.]